MGKTRDTGFLTDCVFTDSSNNVGIGGAANASYKLAVTGAGNFTGALRTSSTFTSGDTIQLGLASTDGGFWTWGASNSFLVAATGKALNLNPNGASGTTGLSIATTGAATFSSTLSAVNGIFNTASSVPSPTGISAWDNTVTTFGGNTTTSNALAIGYNTANNASYILSAQPSVAWRTMWFGASDYRFTVGQGANPSMVITSSGNVGIGTSSPSERLHIVGDAFAGIRINDGTNTALLQWHVSDGFRMVTATAKPLVFFTNDTERMRITSGGLIGIANSGISAVRLAVSYGGGGSIAVGIGVQDVDNATNAQYMQFLNAATTAIGSISRNGGLNQINYNTSSDYRLKEDFKDFNGLEKVTAIKVYDHKWVGFEDRTTSVIAHELAEILPYAVTGEKDAVDENGNIKPQQVDYSKLVPVLVKAIQELTAKVTALENR